MVMVLEAMIRITPCSIQRRLSIGDRIPWRKRTGKIQIWTPAGLITSHRRPFIEILPHLTSGRRTWSWMETPGFSMRRGPHQNVPSQGADHPTEWVSIKVKPLNMSRQEVPQSSTIRDKETIASAMPSWPARACKNFHPNEDHLSRNLQRSIQLKAISMHHRWAFHSRSTILRLQSLTVRSKCKLLMCQIGTSSRTSQLLRRHQTRQTVVSSSLVIMKSARQVSGYDTSSTIRSVQTCRSSKHQCATVIFLPRVWPMGSLPTRWKHGTSWLRWKLANASTWRSRTLTTQDTMPYRSTRTTSVDLTSPSWSMT